MSTSPLRTSEEFVVTNISRSEVEASKKLNKHKLVAVAMEKHVTMLSSHIWILFKSDLN